MISRVILAAAATLLTVPAAAQTDAQTGAASAATAKEDRTGQAPLGEADAQHSLSASSPLPRATPNQVAARAAHPAKKRCIRRGRPTACHSKPRRR